MSYLDENFLLHGKTSRTLYHEIAGALPIFDYHCHLSPELIARDASFETITQAWLSGDHYKWRAMRANGIDERFITGPAGDEEKFAAWARTLPYALRNPLYDWAHLELARYFGISGTLLCGDTASSIYAACNEKLRDASFSAQNLLRRMNVKVVCTTDDPIDDLRHHDQIKRNGFGVKVLPTFRPDKAMAVENPLIYNRYVDALSASSDIAVSTYEQLLEALDKRHAFFHRQGCRCADHALETLSMERASPSDAAAIFSAVRSGKTVSVDEAGRFRAALLAQMCRMNHSRGWVQQIHVGVIRNARTRIFQLIGPDAGADCIGDYSFCRPLCGILDALDKNDALARTLLFNINACDTEPFMSIAGAFQDGSSPGKVQLGPAWWFLDQKDGMRRHLEAFSAFGLLGRFAGMTTDSRSLLSFPRHEYFRRILCDFLGKEMERGDIPDSIDLIGQTIKNICFHNAQQLFGIAV